MTRNLLVLPVIIAISMAFGCGGSKKEGTIGTKRAEGKDKDRLGNIDDGIKCEAGRGRRESLVDLDHDGNSDVRKVYQETDKGEVLICREADLNYDGKIDLYVFYDGSGFLTQDEVDLDLDGNIDIKSIYAEGKVIKQEIDTNSDGLVDRIRYLETGAVFWEKDGQCHPRQVPVRVEGDTDGDRQIDYWEYYESGTLVRIGVDKDNDGRADEWSRIENPEQTACSDVLIESESEEEEGDETGEEEKTESKEEEKTS